mmetsp:Transcript_1594/g.1653  ORF Transcript_1594/g.1653 Transcript_1594/m.1653 type:complete len:190 (-) Transcript_1594:421-990(-)|eukprot:CAMPEP_0171313814 /NCGR_PEP_ID=MMETSP0816-20121228/45840_1 /TAXON_ID=420281 /ORGANISM="Proboscia inermis, Strain CCAP1064/1" /LENGTH=189 /DNA_ID=CAMNT_0011801771 /DNA_START=193 /DNA_END=762 /DNA_ORIENTATION=-
MRSTQRVVAALLSANVQFCRALIGHQTPTFCSRGNFALQRGNVGPTTSSKVYNAIPSTRLMMGFDESDRPISRINKSGLEEILDDIEKGGREDSGYIIIDVREEDEVAFTGKISKHAFTLPLSYIQRGALNMPDNDFMETFGFEKPLPDETIVFTCKAGIRSATAASMAGMSGFGNVINYMGGADEWFQ